MTDEVKAEYKRWVEFANEDKVLVDELVSISSDENKIEDAFYTNLKFGTGGLRGVLGVGTNRMNIYTIRKASCGLGNYVVKNFPKNKSIAISYDSRINSKLFAETSAAVFASLGIHVYLYKQLMPTPLLSFAVRYLRCSAGVMVTASHNPSKYNGYKVYGSDGCQITEEAAKTITNEISLVDPFDVKTSSFETYLKNHEIEYISDDVYDAFINRVKQESVLGSENIDRNVKIVYSALNGTGYKPVTRILKETGFKNIILVEEQKEPDGHFPTCPYPNPEIKEAMSLGIEYAIKNDADLLIATDPDCDRVGIAVKNSSGEFQLITGNQVGVLLLDYIIKERNKNGIMPPNPCAVKTIVTTDMIDAIASKNKVKLYSVLTGFKYIGDTIANLEKDGHESSYILGMEESYGYLTGSYVRDKDAVDGVFMIAEMFAYYKTHNQNLLEVLNNLYKEYGYFLNKLETFEFEGISGMKKMSEVMDLFKTKVTNFGKYKIAKINDYNKGIDGLPSSNVVKFFFNEGHTITVRPSGTEPKLKVYYSIKEVDSNVANLTYEYFSNIIKELVK